MKKNFHNTQYINSIRLLLLLAQDLVSFIQKYNLGKNIATFFRVRKDNIRICLSFYTLKINMQYAFIFLIFYSPIV